MSNVVKLINSDALEKSIRNHPLLHMALHAKCSGETISAKSDSRAKKAMKLSEKLDLNDIKNYALLKQYVHFCSPIFNKAYNFDASALLTNPHRVSEIVKNIRIDGQPYPVSPEDIAKDSELSKRVIGDISMKIWDNAHGKGPIMSAVTAKNHEPIEFDFRSVNKLLVQYYEDEHINEYNIKLQPPKKLPWYKRLFKGIVPSFAEEVKQYNEKLNDYLWKKDLEHALQNLESYQNQMNEQSQAFSESFGASHSINQLEDEEGMSRNAKMTQAPQKGHQTQKEKGLTNTK